MEVLLIMGGRKSKLLCAPQPLQNCILWWNAVVLSGLWMDISGEVADIHMRTDAKNLVTKARIIHWPEQKDTIHMFSLLRKAMEVSLQHAENTHASSTWYRSQSLWSDTWRNSNRTSCCSLGRTTSWSRNSISKQAIPIFLGSNFWRTTSFRARITYSRINVLLRQFRVTCRTRIAKAGGTCSTNVEQSGKEETGTEPVGSSVPTYFKKRDLPMKERKWKSTPAYPPTKKRILSTAISQLVKRLVRHYDQDERDLNSSSSEQHSSQIIENVRFENRGARGSSDKDWLRSIYQGRSKTRFEYCTDIENSLMYLRAIQGHTDDHTILPEAMNHGGIPYN